MKKVSSVVSLVALLLFAVSAMAQTKVVVVPMGGKKPSGDAVAADVLEGKTFSNKDDVGIAGTMVNNGAMAFRPGTSDQEVPEGYHNGSGTVEGDSDLFEGNIKEGATIFGVAGTLVEASGTADPGQVLDGQSFSNASGPALGTMPNIGAQNITPGTAAQPIAPGYHNGSGSVAGDADLTPANIKDGVTLFGQTGTFTETANPLAAADLRAGKVGFANGTQVTGTMPAQTLSNTTTAVAAGYYAAANLAVVDPDLLSQNIACGTTIFGVTGTYSGANAVCSAGRIWMDRNLGASRVATSPTDTQAYGDLYQWGRLADGHQSRTSPTTATLSPGDVPGHGSFITAASSPYDWRTPQNNALWQGVSGTNNPCPAGFRVPTDVELDTERSSWSSNDAAGAFASPLKLVLTGYRYPNTGSIVNAGSQGVYWSSTVQDIHGRYLAFGITSDSAFVTAYYRANGYAVRCLKD
jgi:uncharacterized protein (TIGR02145 family)